jgi:hypothetical protein
MMAAMNQPGFASPTTAGRSPGPRTGTQEVQMRKLIKTTAVSALILGAVSATTVPAQAGSEPLVGGLLGGAAGAGIGAAFGGGKGAAIGGILGLGLGAVIASAQARERDAYYAGYHGERYDGRYNDRYDNRYDGRYGPSRGRAPYYGSVQPAPQPAPVQSGYEAGYAVGYEKGYARAVRGIRETVEQFVHVYVGPNRRGQVRPITQDFANGLRAGYVEGRRAFRYGYSQRAPRVAYHGGRGRHDVDHKHYGSSRSRKPYLHNEWDDRTDR